MNVEIKFSCELTIRNIVKTPNAEEVRMDLEALLKDAISCDLAITEYEQEYTNED